MLMGMAHICDGCGEQVTQLHYRAHGAWAGRWICRDCGTGKKKMTRLSWVVAFRFRLAAILPPDDPITAPVLRLMMAVDDVRRAQIHLVEADERMDVTSGVEKHRALGDWLYFLRLLFSHVHEAGIALRNLDTDAPKRLDEIVVGNREALKSLKTLRRFFSSRDYKDSLVARVRRVIGAHYDPAQVAMLVKAEVTPDTLLESTAASVGGLARMADPVVRAIMNSLNGGDFLADENHTQQVWKALDITGHLITFVDHLFNALLQLDRDALVDQQPALVDVPPLVSRAGEAVQTARRHLQADVEKASTDARPHRFSATVAQVRLTGN